MQGAGIGFHELRQACEISALREDLERLAHEAGALRDGVEQAVETVRDRFAALTAEEMADPMVLAPLLQVAVTTLLEIREQARQLNTRTGPLADDERPSWLGAADAPRLRQPAASDWEPPHNRDALSGDWSDDDVPEEEEPVRIDDTRPLPPAQPALVAPQASSACPSASLPSSALSPVAVVNPSRPASPSSIPAPVRPTEGQASWLASEPAPPPPPSRAATVRANPTGGQSLKGGIDWLGPAGR